MPDQLIAQMKLAWPGSTPLLLLLPLLTNIYFEYVLLPRDDADHENPTSCSGNCPHSSAQGWCSQNASYRHIWSQMPEGNVENGRATLPVFSGIVDPWAAQYSLEDLYNEVEANRLLCIVCCYKQIKTLAKILWFLSKVSNFTLVIVNWNTHQYHACRYNIQIPATHIYCLLTY